MYDEDDDRYEDFSNDGPDIDQGSGICSSCGRPCTAVMVDEGIGPYEYWGSRGVHHDYQIESDCCGAAIAEAGNVYLDKVSFHIARKDHVDKKGKVIVHAGAKYRKHITKGWFINEDGAHCGFIEITKKEVAVAVLPVPALQAVPDIQKVA
jgi:hypothetical protein